MNDEEIQEKWIGQPDKQTNAVPLVVDLDGTLVKTDTLWESVLLLAKHHWFYLVLLPLWLLRGKAYFKHSVASIVHLPVEKLPYNESFIAYLRSEQAKGRYLVLASAANAKIVHSVAAHLGLFHHVLASSHEVNLSGSRKLTAIRELLRESPFDYAGNDSTDLKVWCHARRAILVCPTKAVLNRAPSVVMVEKVFSDQQLSLALYVRAMRLYQWPKNVLVFLPILAAHKAMEWPLFAESLLAFFAWGFCASSVYILNDLLDLANDREHPNKRFRPFASGAIPISHGVMMIPLLLSLSGGLALLINTRFLVVLGVYFGVTLSYSVFIKQVMLMDVITIAGLYTFRVIGGAEAIEITATFWLLAFSMFLFLHLALVKRYADLVVYQSMGRLGLDGRDYHVKDFPLLVGSGISAGYLAVLVLAFYVNSPDILIMYRHPKMVWLLCPLLLYWTSRMWMKAVRGEMHHDPLIYTLRDKASWILAGLSLLILAIAL